MSDVIAAITSHLVGGLCIFTDELNGVPARADHSSDWLRDNPDDAYDTATGDDAAAWGHPDALDGTVTIGQDARAVLLAAMEAMGGVDPYRVPGVFGPAVAVPAQATPHRQLLGCLGRPLDTKDRAGVA